MTGEELKAIQRRAGVSDRQLLAALGLKISETGRRRLRRWKLGAEPVPDQIAEAARALVNRHA